MKKNVFQGINKKVEPLRYSKKKYFIIKYA